MVKIHIASAGNVEVPAYLTLLEKGYSVRWERKSNDNELWFATKGDCEFIGGGPIELLGIACMYESRGNNWKATDEQIDAFVQKYEV